MAASLEREIKLRFPSAEAARAAVTAAGATLKTERRLQHDKLLDTPDGRLRSIRSVLRVRLEAHQSFITFKGPVQASSMKVREEIETSVEQGRNVLEILERLGFSVWFRYEKYREEFSLGDVVLAIDETPVGIFVELEGSERGITTVARLLGFGPDRFVLDSYRGLFLKDCETRGLPATDMLFDPGAA
jgi:adenylate cyclase class 2